jgi:hypothetical protein
VNALSLLAIGDASDTAEWVRNSAKGSNRKERGKAFLRHFVPGYDQPVPPGQKPVAYRSGSQLS